MNKLKLAKINNTNNKQQIISSIALKLIILTIIKIIMQFLNRINIQKAFWTNNSVKTIKTKGLEIFRSKC